LNEFRRTYYWYSHAKSGYEFVPIRACPLCGTTLEVWPLGKCPQSVCEKCSIVTASD